jgi:HD-GYP domain-containing protein (c-di-GMP phosphodiesterase class II)
MAAAEAAEAEQQAALEAAPLDQTYQEALALYVQGKHDQVERIEDRLENLIDRQQARLQQTQANSPGLLSRPGAKRSWQNQQMQQQARLQTLHVRLEAVREIKEGMGLHSPKIEELATRKMRAENPELAADWDAMREAARRHQALMRREEQKRKESLALERPGRSQNLGLTRPV